MSELSITAANVLPTATTALVGTKLAGGAITAGMGVYYKASDDKFYAAQSDGSLLEASTVGVALNSAAAGQYVTVGRESVTIGATVVVGTQYFTSQTAGGIGIATDVASTNYVTPLGVADTATTILVRPTPTGIIKA